MSIPMKPDDPAYWMLFDGRTSTPVVFDRNCYICTDPEFAQMGMPLCRVCISCQETDRGDGHIPADDEVCSVCGFNGFEHYMKQEYESRMNDQTQENSYEAAYEDPWEWI